MTEQTAGKTFAVIAILAGVAYLGWSALTSGGAPSTPPFPTVNHLDFDYVPVDSCEYSEMYGKTSDLMLTSANDAAAVCRLYFRGTSKRPSAGRLRALLKSIGLLRAKGLQETAEAIAKSELTVIDLRGQLGDEAASVSTINILTKIYSGTEGAVTPADMARELRASGPMARTISDDFMITMATLIMENKQ
ncbi:MAG: hypothetical protein ACHQRJ_13370 [Alphaproteobacteria bacterium]